MALEFTTSYLEDAVPLFHYYKHLAERAIEQVTDEQLNLALDEESNSIAIVMKHMAGNMESRWTDFLTSDGEKPDRNRDSEFEDAPASRAALLEVWEHAWSRVFDALASLKEEDLARAVFIRGEKHSVMQAINRQLAHYPYHVGQIVFLAKHFAGKQWHTLSIARKESSAFNAQVAAGRASQR